MAKPKRTPLPTPPSPHSPGSIGPLPKPHMVRRYGDLTVSVYLYCTQEELYGRAAKFLASVELKRVEGDENEGRQADP